MFVWCFLFSFVCLFCVFFYLVWGKVEDCSCVFLVVGGCVCVSVCLCVFFFFFFQAEDGIRVFCLSRGLGDVYKSRIPCWYVWVPFGFRFGPFGFRLGSVLVRVDSVWVQFWSVWVPFGFRFGPFGYVSYTHLTLPTIYSV